MHEQDGCCKTGGEWKSGRAGCREGGRAATAQPTRPANQPGSMSYGAFQKAGGQGKEGRAGGSSPKPFRSTATLYFIPDNVPCPVCVVSLAHPTFMVVPPAPHPGPTGLTMCGDCNTHVPIPNSPSPHPVCLMALSLFPPGRVGHPRTCYHIVRQTGVKPASQPTSQLGQLQHDGQGRGRVQGGCRVRSGEAACGVGTDKAKRPKQAVAKQGGSPGREGGRPGQAMKREGVCRQEPEEERGRAAVCLCLHGRGQRL